jgi:hypothetical protein
MSEVETILQGNSLTLINKAMLKAASVNLEHHGRIVKNGQLEESKFIEDITFGLCEVNSALALKYLSINYPDQFTNFFVIVAHSAPNNKFKRRPIWFNHAVAIVEDNQKLWFSFSPANYKIIAPNPLTSVLQANSLSVIMTQINEMEGGIWPKTTDIENILPKLSKLEIYTLQEGRTNKLFTSAFNFSNSELSSLKNPNSAQIRTNIAKAIEKVKTL